ncbi:MAG TPA: thioredoxin [Chitinophagales bacterium]|nr:thioredoxin [Chitinophagales bacterium]
MEKKLTFQELINGEKPVLVDFFAEWCGPCKMMAPILKDLAADSGDQVSVIKVDVDKNPQVAEHFRIQGVPTLVLFKQGAQIWRQSGVVPLSQLKSTIASVI